MSETEKIDSQMDDTANEATEEIWSNPQATTTSTAAAAAAAAQTQENQHIENGKEREDDAVNDEMNVEANEKSHTELQANGDNDQNEDTNIIESSNNAEEEEEEESVDETSQQDKQVVREQAEIEENGVAGDKINMEAQAETKVDKVDQSNIIEKNDKPEVAETQQNQQIDDEEEDIEQEQQQQQHGDEEKTDNSSPNDENIDITAFGSSPSKPGFSLEFNDFVDVQTRLVLMPFIEEEGKGAIVASYPEDDRFEGLVLVSIGKDQNQEALQTADFTDILCILREHPVPITLRFKAPGEDDEEDEKNLMVDVGISGNTDILEEKKDDDCGEQDAEATTPKTGNHDEKPNSANHKTESIETSISPRTTYLEKRQSSTPREHTKSLNSVLDDHRNGRNGDGNGSEGNGMTLSSGMFALSAWGMRMKAQSEKLLATAGAKASEQARKQHPEPTVSSKSSANESASTCDMYLQTNLGTYFPISKQSKSNGPQHLQAVTTSSLYCIRKSATEPCVVGRDTMHNNNPVRYSFQWYRSSSKKKSSRDRFPLSPKTLYSKENFDEESIGASTLTSKRTRTYSSASDSSSCSSWSSSSYSSASSSSYSMSTAGVTHHTFSVASYASGTNTTGSKTAKDMNRETLSTGWIPLEGATGATFQPNTTLVGKRLRCVVTIRPVRGTSSDEEDDSSSFSAPMKSPKSGAIMVADDFDNNVNDVSALEDDTTLDGARDESHRSLLPEEGEGVERIVCDLAIPIQADMILFNGARQALTVKGSASFGNLLGRGGETSSGTSASPTSACGKTFRVEVGTTRKIVLYTPPPSVGSDIPKPQRRYVNVNMVHIYWRPSPEDEYLRLTDIPLFQVTAKASPTNSKHVDLLFPAIPPSSIDENGKSNDNFVQSSTQKFLSTYCIVDRASSSDSAIPRLELETPNRMTRESFLLALGIANFRGKASQLDNKKVLFRDDEAILNQSQNQSQQNSQAPTFSNDKSSPPKPDSPPEEKSEASSPEKESRGNLAVDEGTTGGQVISGNLALSPCRPSNVISEPKNVLSPISCQSNTEDSRQQGETVIPFPTMPSEAEANLARVKELEREMAMLRAKLARKDQITTELQRHSQSIEAAHQKTKHVLAKTRQELKQSQEDCERIQISKRHVERSMQMEYEATQKLKSDHQTLIKGYGAKLSNQADKIAELEKLNRALQNEKAVLGATVEARESKLVKLEELQVSNSELSKKVAQQGVLEAQLEESHKKHDRLQTELENSQKAEAECRKELEAARSRIQNIQKRMKGDQEKASTWQTQLEALQKTNQQLKGERNSYKQKNESLSKEVSRLCRGGKNIRDIEKVLADHESLLQETELLRVQKRKALEEAHKYRISYEQAKAAEEALALKPDERETRRILERTAELERLLSEMTDYVSAKQMQLDTLKEVNEELQKEIHSLAQANLRSDEI